MLPQIEIEVENIKGHCTRGYKKGDRWRVKGFDTPDCLVQDIQFQVSLQCFWLKMGK